MSRKMKQGVEVILKNVDAHPECPHGPTLIFERYTSNGKNSGRRFFACSACRSRSECNFFHWVDEKFSANLQEHWKLQKKQLWPQTTHLEYMRKLEKFKEISVKQRRFCKSCSMLLLPKELAKHNNHEVLTGITDCQLQQPSELFKPKENDKAEAQYFFSSETTEFIVKLLGKLGFTRVVCVGTPKIHEYIVSKGNNELTSILLDIDQRYMQFYSDQHFYHYNMFNNHFFSGKNSKQSFKQFLSCNSDKVVIIVDPPFGGLIDPVSFTLKEISQVCRNNASKQIQEQIPLLWFFPYFNEGRILENMPNMTMMDYQVEYSNHKAFSKKKKSSPIRVFTNIKPALFTLPDNKYKYCSMCERYVSKTNTHCFECKACTTKHGDTYKHCDQCKQCVKPSHEHCNSCNKCALIHSDCNKVSNVTACFFCKDLGHRKRNCPDYVSSQISQKKKKKGGTAT